MFRQFFEFLRDDSGQDLVEYAYLAAFIGVVGVLVWAGIVGLLGTNYSNQNTSIQNLWVSPPP